MTDQLKPTPKSPEIDNLLTSLAGKSRQDTVSEGCMTCDKPNLDFRDPLSRKEYQISGMCQTCQDSVFGG